MSYCKIQFFFVYNNKICIFRRDSTYSIHVESLNCILIMLSIQMYTIQPSSSLITYRYFDLKLIVQLIGLSLIRVVNFSEFSWKTLMRRDCLKRCYKSTLNKSRHLHCLVVASYMDWLVSHLVYRLFFFTNYSFPCIFL